MSTFHLIYNPYRIKTVLRVKANKEWVEIGTESKLRWIENIRMQVWLMPQPDKAWSGFFNELQEISGETDFEIQFSGTLEDMDDLVLAAKEYNNDGLFDIKVIPYCDEKQKMVSSIWKLSMLQTWADKARRNNYYGCFPDDIKKLFADVQKPTMAQIKVIDLEEPQHSELTVLSRSSWDLGLFSFHLSSVSNRGFKQKVRNLFDSTEYQYELARGQDRLLFLCICEELQLQYKDHIENQCKDFYLECGIGKRTTYFLTKWDWQAMINKRTLPCPSLPLFEPLRLYMERYAEQVRLLKQIESFFDIAGKNRMFDPSFLRQITVSSEKAVITQGTDGIKEENPIGRLYDQLITWRYRDEMLGIENFILSDLKVELHGVDFLKKCSLVFSASHDRNMKLWVFEHEKLQFLYWYKSYMKDILILKCQTALQSIESRFLGVCEEFISEYMEDAEHAERNITAWQVSQALDLVSPITDIDSMDEYSFNAGVQLSQYDKRAVCVSDFHNKTRINIESGFESWLKAYCNHICGEIGSLVKIVAGYMPSEERTYDINTGSNYRKKLEQKNKIQQEAMNWLREFLMDMRHLLDVE